MREIKQPEPVPMVYLFYILINRNRYHFHSLGNRFVKMYVNADTLDLAPDCVEALNTLYAQAHAQGLVPSNPPLTII